MIYESIMKLTGVDKRIIDIANGNIEHPNSFVETNLKEFPILPAMIPAWCDSLNTTGLWRHWFVSSRMTVFAEQRPEFDYNVEEIARSLEQFITIECYKEISASDGISQEVDIFLGLFPETDKYELEKIYNQYDYDQTELLSTKHFKSDPPLYCEPTQYKGDFPNFSMSMTAEYIRKTCTVEYDEDLKQQVSALDIAPEWFKTNDQAPLFYQLLDKADFAGAWMSLNSNGWEFSEAKKAILKLADKANDSNFTILANTWASQPHEKFGSY